MIQKKIRNAADPYIIHLTEEPYLLRKEMLKQDTDLSVQRKRDWKYPSLKFISCKNGTLKLLNIHQEKSYEMTVIVLPTQLQVSCNCGSEVETICHHVYNALDSLMFMDYTRFFEQYQRGGLVEIATSHKKYFTITETNKSLEILPRGEIKPLYHLTDKLKLNDFTTVMDLPGASQTPVTKMKDAALTYIIIDAYKDLFPPFLLPCIGYLNKAGTEVRRFDNFISGTEKKYDPYLTEDQKALNRLCYEMWQLAESMNGSFYKESVADLEKLKILLELWQHAFTLLQHESFTYLYCLYWKRELKRRPSRQQVDRIEIKPEKPVFQFQLLDREQVFQLQLKLIVKNRSLENPMLDHMFFVREQENIYLLNSLKDAGLTEWFNKTNNCITVFKEHFDEFEKQILNPLRENYLIETVKCSPLRFKKIKG
jgi:hypothetical protein